MKKKEEKYCGECCWFFGEDTYGFGMCPHMFAELKKCDEKCSVPSEYVSEERMRHLMAVLVQYNRFRRDDEDLYRCPPPAEIGEAIDLVVKYMKTFNKR